MEPEPVCDAQVRVPRTAQPFFSKVESELNRAGSRPSWDYSIARERQLMRFPAPRSLARSACPRGRSELYLEYHRGVFTTQANHKRNMRDSEEWVLNAEKYASLAWLERRACTPRPTRLTDAWKLVLFNQFHDLAAGSGIGVPSIAEAQKDYDQVRWSQRTRVTPGRAQLASIALASTPASTDGVPVLVSNPLA